MYSPKISNDLIPELYKLSKHFNKPMTQVVDDILRNYILIYENYNSISPATLKNLLEMVLKKD
jgi:predicted choloylglycine hydrolase